MTQLSWGGNADISNLTTRRELKGVCKFSVRAFLSDFFSGFGCFRLGGFYRCFD